MPKRVEQPLELRFVKDRDGYTVPQDPEGRILSTLRWGALAKECKRYYMKTHPDTIALHNCRLEKELDS